MSTREDMIWRGGLQDGADRERAAGTAWRLLDQRRPRSAVGVERGHDDVTAAGGDVTVVGAGLEIEVVELGPRQTCGQAMLREPTTRIRPSLAATRCDARLCQLVP
jgi:hypothetical protein